MKKKAEKRKAEKLKFGAVTVGFIFYFLFSTFTFAGGTPSAPVLLPTSTVRFVWDALPVSGVSSYDYGEKIGADYKLLGNTTWPMFSVPNIGTKPRTFWVAPRTASGTGVIKEFTFPGMLPGVRLYVEVMLK